MANLQNLIGDLVNKCELTESEIVAALTTFGVTTTQPTINRILHGKIRNPGFDIGYGLVQLHRSKMKRARVA